MIIKDFEDCEEFLAGDYTILRELFHPANTGVKTSYSLAHAMLKPGKASRPHRLTSSEVYYILEGEGVMHIGDEAERVHPGQAIFIPPKAKQYIQNIGNCELKFLCIVDPAWRQENEEIV